MRVSTLIPFAIIWGFLALFSSGLFGQNKFHKVYSFSQSGSDRALGISPYENNGYLITGITSGPQNGFGRIDAFLIALDSAGNVLWNKIEGDGNRNIGRLLTKLNTNSYVWARLRDQNNLRDVIILSMVDSLGNSGPNSFFGETTGGRDTEIYGMLCTNDTILIAGGTRNLHHSGSNSDGFLIAMDTNLTPLYSTIVDNQNGEEFYFDLKTLANGDVILVGRTRGLTPNSMMFLSRMSGGSVIWNRTLGPFSAAASETLNSLVITENSEILAVGISDRFSANREGVLVRMDLDGNYLGGFRYFLSGDIAFNKITRSPEVQDKYLIAGYAEIGGNRDALLLSVDSIGTVDWAKSYGGAAADIFSDIMVSDNGGVLCVGHTSLASSSNLDILVISSDSTGMVADTCFPAQINLTQAPINFVIDTNGTAIDSFITTSFSLSSDTSFIADTSICSTILKESQISLSSKLTYDSVQLNWNDHNECNNCRYEIQRSPDNRFFNAIKSLEKDTHFGFDDAPLEGIAYYRILKVAENNKKTVSNVETVFWEKTYPSIGPNPIDQSFTISLPDAWLTSPLKVQLINSTAGDVYRTTLQKPLSHNVINLNLPAGIYYLRLNNASGKVFSFRLSKQ